MQTLEFDCYDGTQWRNTWDTSAGDTNLPVAVRVRIQLVAKQGEASGNVQPLEMLVLPKFIALAIALAGMAIFMNSRKFFLVASSELLSDSSVAIAPGEIIVQRIFWECSSIRSPSVNARAAALVAQ